MRKRKGEIWAKAASTIWCCKCTAQGNRTQRMKTQDLFWTHLLAKHMNRRPWHCCYFSMLPAHAAVEMTSNWLPFFLVFYLIWGPFHNQFHYMFSFSTLTWQWKSSKGSRVYLKNVLPLIPEMNFREDPGVQHAIHGSRWVKPRSLDHIIVNI